MPPKRAEFQEEMAESQEERAESQENTAKSQKEICTYDNSLRYDLRKSLQGSAKENQKEYQHRINYHDKIFVDTDDDQRVNYRFRRSPAASMNYTC
ncbi:hypothetical protein BGZ49_002417, partial [Haplosporangium sp. Z 27]